MKLTLSDLLRPGTDATTGARGHPAKQIVFSMGFLGVAFAFNVRRFADPEGFLLAVFTFIPVTLALAILPDTFEVRERKMEILRCKPVTGETLTAARAGALLTVAALMAAALSAAPFAAAVLWLDLPAWRVLPLFAGLLAAGFAALLFWLAFALVVAQWLGVERLRHVTQTVLVVLTLGLVLFSFAGFAFGDIVGGGKGDVSGRHPALAFLPPAWFAAAGLPGFGPAGPFGVLAALALVGIGFVLNTRLDGDRLYERFAERRPAVGRAPVSAAVLRVLTAVPPGSWLVPPRARGVARLVLTVGAREEVSRMKSLAPRLLVALFFAYAVMRPGDALGPSLVAISGFFALIDGLAATRQSAIPAAAWIFYAAPLQPRDVMRGVRAALLVRSFALPVALLAFTLARTHAPAPAALLAVGYLLHGSLVVSLSAVVNPTLPLSQDHTASPGLLGLFGTQVLALGAGLSFVVLYTLAAQLGTIGTAIAGVLLVPLSVASLAARLFAVRRLRSVELSV